MWDRFKAQPQQKIITWLHFISMLKHLLNMKFNSNFHTIFINLPSSKPQPILKY